MPTESGTSVTLRRGPEGHWTISRSRVTSIPYKDLCTGERVRGTLQRFIRSMKPLPPLPNCGSAHAISLRGKKWRTLQRSIRSMKPLRFLLDERGVHATTHRGCVQLDGHNGALPNGLSDHAWNLRMTVPSTKGAMPTGLSDHAWNLLKWAFRPYLRYSGTA